MDSRKTLHRRRTGYEMREVLVLSVNIVRFERQKDCSAASLLMAMRIFSIQKWFRPNTNSFMMAQYPAAPNSFHLNHIQSFKKRVTLSFYLVEIKIVLIYL